MKLAISTLPFKEWSVEKTVQFCQECGYDALEIRMDFHPWSDSSLPNEHYNELAKLLPMHRLCVCGLGSGIVLTEYNEDALCVLRRQLELAGILGASGVRIMLGNIRRCVSDSEKTIHWEGLVHWLQVADALAGSFGKQVWIETHNEFATGKALHDLFAQTKLPHTAVIWDLMHPLEQEEPIEQTLSLLQGRIAHIHVKDGLPWNDPKKLIWKYTPLGEGRVPIEHAVRLLRQSGYNGYYSLEWESAWRKELLQLNRDEECIISFIDFMHSINK
ncbi:sugar phosphate isomerase/epimerase family protein [Ruthenibacterium lactatiformans]|uniref:sugar phosphate isomerase/epimerase family protein n=1 Tax=Ruthenibacterium lactatiformans TaxID=1550024 RepID=UPI0026DC5375|nr:sugar phosphate isomerase/epimerase [Ruthenibacterium lactatiformans]